MTQKLTDLYGTMATLPNGISAVDHIREGRDSKYDSVPLPEVPKPDMGYKIPNKATVLIRNEFTPEFEVIGYRMGKSTVLRHDTLDNRGKV